MRTKCWPAILLVTWPIVAGTARSDEQSTARGIIDEAIRAMGGEARLARFHAATWKSKGTFRVGDNAREFTSEWAIQGPNQYRKLKRYREQGDDSKTILVLNQDQVWFWTKRGVVDFRAQQSVSVRAENYTHWLALRLDIKGAAQLSVLDETPVDSRPAVGVRVRERDAPDVDLYFDKNTRLLVRTDTYVTSSRGEKVSETRVFRNYNDAGGIKYASAVHWTGRSGDEPAIQEEERWEFAVHERLDESLFAKP